MPRNPFGGLKPALRKQHKLNSFTPSIQQALQKIPDREYFVPKIAENSLNTLKIKLNDQKKAVCYKQHL